MDRDEYGKGYGPWASPGGIVESPLEVVIDMGREYRNGDWEGLARHPFALSTSRFFSCASSMTGTLSSCARSFSRLVE